jgi:hypothetical protein
MEEVKLTPNFPSPLSNKGPFFPQKFIIFSHKPFQTFPFFATNTPLTKFTNNRKHTTSNKTLSIHFFFLHLDLFLFVGGVYSPKKRNKSHTHIWLCEQTPRETKYIAKNVFCKKKRRIYWTPTDFQGSSETHLTDL